MQALLGFTLIDNLFLTFTVLVVDALQLGSARHVHAARVTSG